LLLSGGLDSSSIALASTRLGRPVTALSLGAPGVPDEANLAMRLAEYLGLPTVGPVHIPTQDVNSVLDEVVMAMQEPQCHPAILTSHVMSQAASPYFKVLLTGDGAEEVLGGYKWYDAQDTFYRSWRLAASLRRLVRGMLSSSTVNAEHRRLVEQFTATSALHRHVWHTYKAMFMPAELRALFGPSAGEVFTEEEDILAPLHVHYEPALPYRRSLQRLDMMTFCAEALLPKVRRIAAAQGMEVRLPFLDRRVIDWALAYPYEERERKQRKPLLHDYLRGHVPEAILKLPKHGFNPPWFEGLNWEQALNEIRTGYWVKEGYWSATVLEEFVKKGAPCWQQRLWSLTVLTRWASV
jgi:asparagine synthase (glutamine-hydrolysing)